MTWGVYVLVFLVMAIASTVQTSVGMGQGLISAPLLRLLEPDLLPGPIVLAGFMTTIVVAAQNSERADLKQVTPAIGGRVIGNLVAIGLLAALSESGLTIAIGVIVLVLVILRLIGIGPELTPTSLGIAGIASGVGGTIAALGGAPMGLLYEKHAKARNFRGPLGAFGIVGNVLSLGLLALAGELNGRALGLGLALVPPLALGWLAARWVTPYVDRGLMRPLVLTVSAGSALVLLGSQLL